MKISVRPVKFYGYAAGAALLFLTFLAGSRASGDIGLPLVAGFIMASPVICYGAYETFKFKDVQSQRNYGVPTIGLIGLMSISIIIIASIV